VALSPIVQAYSAVSGDVRDPSSRCRGRTPHAAYRTRLPSSGPCSAPRSPASSRGPSSSPSPPAREDHQHSCFGDIAALPSQQRWGLGPALADDATSLAFTLTADICTLLLLHRLPVRLGLSDPVQKTTYIVAVQQRSRSCSPCATRRACRLPGGHVRVSRVLGCCPTRRGADVVAFIS
jgi:hypothetical protein